LSVASCRAEIFITLGLFLPIWMCYRWVMSSSQDITETDSSDVRSNEVSRLDPQGLLKLLEEEKRRAEEEKERADHFKDLYDELLVRCRKLEKGLLTTTSEKLSEDQLQLTLGVLGMALGTEGAGESADADDDSECEDEQEVEVKGHKRKRGGGRQKLPEDLPRRQEVLIPDEVLNEGRENFLQVGEERTETIERQAAQVFVLEIIRPKYVRKDRDRDRSQEAQIARDLANESYTDFLVAEPPCHPIPKSIAGPQLLADTIVYRYEDHLPLYRLERIFKREGIALARSTICGWHSKIGALIAGLYDAMWADARGQPILYTDATGVRVQAEKKCRNAHFWAVIVPDRHLLYAYTEHHKKSSIGDLLDGFDGTLVADAHTVYDHLYLERGVTEAGCWSHCRRYFHKALDSQPDLALEGLLRINQLFRFERQWKNRTATQRRALRKRKSKPVIKAFFNWCEAHLPRAFEGTPFYKALNYALNQRIALQRFLGDGRLPIHNNASERALRRHAIGRKNWLFLGNDEAGHTNARLVTLLASCALHDVEPRAYLRDLFCLLPVWPKTEILDLAPLNWNETSQREDVVAILTQNAYWRAATGMLPDDPE